MTRPRQEASDSCGVGGELRKHAMCAWQSMEDFDATIIAQKILSAVIRTGERFGAGYIAQVLARLEGGARAAAGT